ncbi:MAG: riboflavin synthase [bacterium]
MFTGLIQKAGTLSGKKPRGDGLVLTLRHDAWESPLIQGESVAVQGVCLTVTAVRTGEFSCDVLNETLTKTNLGKKEPGAPLNLERALRADERLGGHIVSGHVDGLGKVMAFDQKGPDWVLEVSCDESLLRGMVPKGSIAIDGISLTIVALRPKSFTVHLIPHTLANTSLKALKKGHSVNLETDIIGKYVQRYLECSHPVQGVTMEKLNSAFGLT